jgi:hypothetical protein
MAERRHKRNSTFKKSQLLTLLFADDQVTISNKVSWQKAAYKLNNKMILCNCI